MYNATFASRSRAAMEQRQEPRKKADLLVSISGRDKAGESFIQDALASSLSASGALLSGITRDMRSGDLIWIEYSGRKARFRIVWVRNSDSHQLTQAAVHRLGADDCPWGEF